MDEELFSPFFNGNLPRSSASASSKLLFENIEVQKSSSIFAADSSPVSKFAEKKTGDPIKVEPEIEFGKLTGLKSVEAMSPAAGLSSLASEPNVAISKPLKIESSSIKEGDGSSLSTPDKQSRKVIHDSVFPVSIQRKSNSSDCGRPATATERAPPVHAAIQFESRGISRNDLSRPLENKVSEVAATSFDHCTSKKVVRLFGVERKGRDVRVRSQDIAGPRGRGRGPGKESERSHLQHQPLLRDHLAHLDRPPDTGPRKGRRQHQVSAGGGRLGDLPGGHHVPGALSPEVQCPLRGAHGQDSARGHLQQDEHITGIWDSIRKPFSYGHVKPPRHLKAALDDVLKDKYYKIVKGLSAAFLYLHEEWEETVVHKGVTASNVFLDADLSPHLGGFALAEFVAHGDNDHHATGAVRGIFGYMSPEYVASGRATTEADVFSFGVVVLEVVSGRMAVDFRFPAVLRVDKIRQFDKKERLVDVRLEDGFDQKEISRSLTSSPRLSLSRSFDSFEIG